MARSDKRQWRGRPGGVTIHAVAEKAGVSLATVSHSLNGKGRVSPETRRRVLEAASSLGYVANRQARALKTGRTMTLLAVLPGVSSMHSAFITDILLGAAEEAIRNGYFVTVAGRALTAMLVEGPPRYDGAVVVDPTADDSSVELIERDQVPTVTIGRMGRDDPYSVDNDYPDGMSRVLRHLAVAGYRRPALVTTGKRVSYSLASISAFGVWSAKVGIDPKVHYVSGYPSVRNGQEATAALLDGESECDAIIGTTEPLAVGALKAIEQAGLRLGSDIGLASIHDSERLRAATVAVTALDLRATVLGREAVATLVSLLEEPDSAIERNVVVTTRLLPRASTRRRAKSAGERQRR